MKEKGRVLQLAPMDRLLRKAGAERVSLSAKEELRRVLEEFGISISRKAIEFANHAGRTTIKSDDVLLASKQ
jgi:histone H3/H4